MRAGNLDHARDLLQAALATDAELGLEREAVDALHSLALLAARTGDTPRAARLAAAAEAERARLGCVALRSTLDGLEAARASSLERGTEDWDMAWAEGEQLSLAEAIAYARRRRGRRDRPAAGWGSLTPAELRCRHARRRRPFEPADRRAAIRLASDGEDASLQRVSQAACGQSHRACRRDGYAGLVIAVVFASEERPLRT